MTPLVQIRNVHKHFTRGSERIDVLKGVNLDIPQGDFLALMGPSGSGKTIVMVTHDPHAAERAKRTLHLEKGTLMEVAAA